MLVKLIGALLTLAGIVGWWYAAKRMPKDKS
jgi:hypothetical protein